MSTGWAVADARGILVATVRATRAAAIAFHVAWHLPASLGEQPKDFAIRGRLDPLQHERWRWARRHGSRVVKVVIKQVPAKNGESFR
jgi:hypothetical protein